MKLTVFVHEKVVWAEYEEWIKKLPKFGIQEIRTVMLYRKPTLPGEQEERMLCREFEVDLNKIIELKEKVPQWARKLVGLG